MKELVLYNRADLMYEVLYREIITPMIKCEVDGNVEGYCRIVKCMVEYTSHFWRKGKDKDDILKKLSDIYMQLIALKQNPVTEGQKKTSHEKRAQLFKEISELKMNAFSEMHKVKIFVMTVTEDNRPVTAKSYDDMH